MNVIMSNLTNISIMTEIKLGLIKSKLSKYRIEYSNVNGTPGIIIDKDDVVYVCRILKEDEELSYDLLLDEFGVDRFQKKNRFEVICNVYSVKFKDRLFIRIKLDSKYPEMNTLSSVWLAANWHEREAYDMFGINFIAHPDLRRIYMPEEYEQHPLRKDFPLMGKPGTISLPNK
jgi:NADH-quinone oxidoreductase subunit C